jgi:hypothetical protein
LVAVANKCEVGRLIDNLKRKKWGDNKEACEAAQASWTDEARSNN